MRIAMPALVAALFVAAGTGTALAVTPPVVIKSFGAATMPVDATTSLTFTVANNDNSTTLTAVGFSDTLPANMTVTTPNGLTGGCGGGTITAVAGSGQVSLSGASLSANTSCTFSLSVTASSAAQYTNVTSPVTSSEAGNGNSAVASITVLTPPTITKAFGAGTITINGTTTLGFSITNNNFFAALSGVAFTDSFPAGLEVATPNGLTGSCGGGVITATPGNFSVSLSNATLAGNSSCIFSVNVTATTLGFKNNSTTVTSTEGGTGNITNAQIEVVRAVTHDFNGDGKSDILWHHSNGSVSTWQMNANGTHTAFSFGTVNTAWQIAGTQSLVASTGDVDGAGKADIFWRHTNGSLSLWEMNGGNLHTPLSLGVVNTAWQIAGVGDFDGDGHADILWRHTNGGLSIWKMAANGTHTSLSFGVVPTAWSVAGIGDVNGNGKADIVWRHTNGTVLIWKMNGGTSHTVLNLGVVATAWQIVGVGDVDGDGNADLFWRHLNGSLSIWKMAANGTHTALSLGTVASAWQIASIGDYNGDGHADILWRNSNGAASIWLMNANGTHTPLGLGAPATAWIIVE